MTGPRNEGHSVHSASASSLALRHQSVKEIQLWNPKTKEVSTKPSMPQEPSTRQTQV